MAELAYVGGKIDEQGYSAPWYSTFSGGAATSLAETAAKVVQRAAGANMSVDVSVGKLFIPISSSYGYWGEVTSSAKNVAVDAADPSNPRIDRLVAYIDLSAISTSLTNNDGALKFKAVAGTAAGSPTAPVDATVQTSIGAGNPFIDLATLAVSAADTSIVTADITDKRTPVALRTPLKSTIATVTATTVLSWGYNFVNASAAGGAIVLTLPDATLNPGGRITVRRTDSTVANTLQILRPLAQTINGVTSIYLPNQYDWVELMSDGTNWTVVQNGLARTIKRVALTSTVNISSTTVVIITGVTLSAVVPTTASEIALVLRTASIRYSNITTSCYVYEGVIASGGVAKNKADASGDEGGSQKAIHLDHPYVPGTAGALTFEGGMNVSSGNADFFAAAASPAYLEVQLRKLV